jgi:hypothetical protein
MIMRRLEKAAAAEVCAAMNWQVPSILNSIKSNVPKLGTTRNTTYLSKSGVLFKAKRFLNRFESPLILQANSY